MKLKVRDTLKPQITGFLTLYDIGLEGFESISEGDRVRIVNAMVMQNQRSLEIQLIVNKGSKLLSMTALHKKQGNTDLIKKHLEMAEQQVVPSELYDLCNEKLEAYNSNWQSKDVQFYLYTLKHITSKHPHTGAVELRKVIGLTHEQQYVVLDILDRTFIDSAVFPKEGSFIVFENLQYLQSVSIDQRDLSFTVFTNPSENNQTEFFCYDLY